MKNVIRTMAAVVALVVCSTGVAFAEQCVVYVKRVKPAYNKTYCLKTDHGPKAKKYSWVPANDLWNRLWVTSRGADPVAGSVFIMDKSGSIVSFKDLITGKNVTMDVGHTGVVTGVSKDKKTITVSHSNWETSNAVTGTFTRSSTSSTTWYYTPSKGAKWRSGYTISGFVYTP